MPCSECQGSTEVPQSIGQVPYARIQNCARFDLGTSDDYMKERMPSVNVGLLDGKLAWRQHDGGHTDGPNWKYFIPWADKFLKHASAARPSQRP